MYIGKLLLILCTSTLAAFVNADVITAEDIQPVNNDTLAQYRGGFKVTEDYVINIGLSISTTINGENLLNTTIANLVIENGNLSNIHSLNGLNTTDQRMLDQGIVNIIQFGDGNIIGSGNADAPKTPSPTVVSSELINSSIINIIQNSTDNSVIGLNTLVDIDAQVSGVLQQIRANQRLEDALLNHLH